MFWPRKKKQLPVAPDQSLNAYSMLSDTLHVSVFAVPSAQNTFPWTPVYMRQELENYFFTIYVLLLCLSLLWVSWGPEQYLTNHCHLSVSYEWTTSECSLFTEWTGELAKRRTKKELCHWNPQQGSQPGSLPSKFCEASKCFCIFDLMWFSNNHQQQQHCPILPFSRWVNHHSRLAYTDRAPGSLISAMTGHGPPSPGPLLGPLHPDPPQRVSRLIPSW